MSVSKFRIALIAGALAMSSTLFARNANAAFIINVEQSGANVSITGSGTLNTTALTAHTGSGVGYYLPSSAIVVGGPAFPNGVSNISYSGAITGAKSLGTGSTGTFSSTHSGDEVGIGGSAQTLTVPGGYVSGAALSFSDTITSQTISGIGFTDGSYNYTWGSGTSADSLTVNIGAVPEPSSLGLLGFGGVALLRRRRVIG